MRSKINNIARICWMEAVRVVCRILMSYVFLWVNSLDLFSQPMLTTGREGLDELLMTGHRQWFESRYSEYHPDMTVLQAFPVGPESVNPGDIRNVM